MSSVENMQNAEIEPCPVCGFTNVAPCYKLDENNEQIWRLICVVCWKGPDHPYSKGGCWEPNSLFPDSEAHQWVRDWNSYVRFEAEQKIMVNKIEPCPICGLKFLFPQARLSDDYKTVTGRLMCMVCFKGPHYSDVPNYCGFDLFKCEDFRNSWNLYALSYVRPEIVAKTIKGLEAIRDRKLKEKQGG